MRVKLQVEINLDVKNCSEDVDSFAFVCSLESARVFLKRFHWHLVQKDLTVWELNDGTSFVFVPESAPWVVSDQMTKIIDGAWLGESGTWYKE